MNKKKILTIVISIILIILILYLLYGFRNYAILKDLAKKAVENEKSTNYSYSFTIVSPEKNAEEIRTLYYKDGILVSKENDKVRSWKDTNNGEHIEINYDNNTAKVTKYRSSPESMYVPVVWATDPSIISGFKTFISTEKIDGEECYVIENFCANKENGTLIRYYFSDDNYLKFTDWKFEKVTDKDVEKPNLEGFQIEEV